MIRVMIVDDHEVVRAGLAMLLGRFDDLLLVGEAPHSLRITAAGLALDITKEPNWRPLGVHGDRKAMLTDGGRS